MVYKHVQTLTFMVSSLFVMIVMGAGISFPPLIDITATPTNIAPGTVAIDAYDFEMVYVPAGEYEMGTTEEEFKTLCESTFKGSSKVCSDFINSTKDVQNFEKRKVKVASFWIDRYEVTIKKYQACALSPNGCRSIATSNSKLDDDPQKPQFGVAWYDAMFFCNRRRARLPTEMEWEYAARGPNNFIFPWGNTYNRNYVSPSDATYRVGSIQQNKSWVGAFDMAGNVAEWTEDRFYSNERQFASDADDIGRVIRGGSWGNQTTQIATFDRAYAPPDSFDSTIGFRCLRSSHP
jgi:formylglycine-generating enzyme required for sulfatase activity